MTEIIFQNPHHIDRNEIQLLVLPQYCIQRCNPKSISLLEGGESSSQFQWFTIAKNQL